MMAIIDDVIQKLKDKKVVVFGPSVTLNLGAPGVKSYGFEDHILWTKDNLNTKYIYNLDTGIYFSYKDE